LVDVEIGVVTKAPRPYAQKLLTFHGLDVPVIVAYHDVSRQKPHPEALLKAAAKWACRRVVAYTSVIIQMIWKRRPPRGALESA